MGFSRGKLLLAAALCLSVAGVGSRLTAAHAAQTVNLATPPGADHAETGFAIRNGYAVQILESGGVPGAQVLFAPCTSTGTLYRCDPASGTVITLDEHGATNVNLNFNVYTQPIDAVIGTNAADANDQVIAVFNTTNIPTAYTQPGPLPYSAVVPASAAAPAATTQQSCFYLPLSGFAPSCFFGTIPGIGVGYVSPFSLGTIPGFNSGFLPGFGFFYVPFGTVTTFGSGGVIFLQPTAQLLPSLVCPAGFHGNLTVVLGSAGFPFGTFFGFGALTPFGVQTATVVCP